MGYTFQVKLREPQDMRRHTPRAYGRDKCFT